MFVLFFVFLFAKFREAAGAAAHRVIDRLSVQIVPGRGDDSCGAVQLTDDCDILCQLFLTHILCAGKNDTGRGCDLIIKEFLEVPVIDLAAVRVYDGGITCQLQPVNSSDSPKDIRELSDTGRFNDDPFRGIGIQYLFQTGLKIPFQGTADTAAVDFPDFNSGFLQKSAVDADFSEFIFYQYDFLACEHVLDQFGDQGCFAGSKKA